MAMEEEAEVAKVKEEADALNRIKRKLRRREPNLLINLICSKEGGLDGPGECISGEER